MTVEIRPLWPDVAPLRLHWNYNCRRGEVGVGREIFKFLPSETGDCGWPSGEHSSGNEFSGDSDVFDNLELLGDFENEARFEIVGVGKDAESKLVCW